MEREIEAIAETSLRAWLDIARDAALPALTAAVIIPPDPDAVTRTSAQWEHELDTGFIPKLGAIVDRLLGDDRDRLGEWRTRTLSAARTRLLGIPGRAFKRVSAAVRDAVKQTVDAARDLVAEALSWAGWSGEAAQIGRNEGVALFNATRLAKAQLEEQDTGQPLDKMWLSLHDDRVRTTHQHADRQRRPLAADFQVGGFSLRYPGDPLGPPEEVIGCRCVVVVLDSAPDSLENAYAASAAPTEGNLMAGRTFEALLMPAGVIGRSGISMLSAEAKLLDTKLPLALKWQPADIPAHDGSLTVGAIETLEMRDGGLWGTGTLLDGPDTEQAIQQIEAGVTAPSAELVVRTETLADGEGNPITPESAEALWESGEQVIMRMDEVEIVGASLVSVPEFRETSIALGEAAEQDAPDMEAIAAAAVITEPEYDEIMFAPPELAEPTPIHVDDDGHVSGHLAIWGTCHTGRRDKCVTPYKSHSDYADFHQSHVKLSTGDRLRVGRLTVGGGHAPAGDGPRAAVEHYDNVSTCWALVRAGEDEHGIWISGVVNPAADTAMVQQALTAPHSGHWERVGGHPELIAAHAVNTPGFPIAVRKRDRTGDLALVASFGPAPTQALDTSILDAVADRAVRAFVAQQAGAERATTARQLVTAAAGRKRILADAIREDHARTLAKINARRKAS